MAANELQLADLNLAGAIRIKIDGDMFGDEIVRTIADNDRRISNVQSFRKNIGQFDFLFRIWRTRTERRFRRIHHNAHRMSFHILDRARNSATQKREQSVIDSGKIDIDRFDITRPGWNGMKIFDHEVGEDTAFELEVDFQIFLRRIVKRDAMPDT